MPKTEILKQLAAGILALLAEETSEPTQQVQAKQGKKRRNRNRNRDRRDSASNPPQLVSSATTTPVIEEPVDVIEQIDDSDDPVLDSFAAKLVATFEPAQAAQAVQTAPVATPTVPPVVDLPVASTPAVAVQGVVVTQESRRQGKQDRRGNRNGQANRNFGERVESCQPMQREVMVIPLLQFANSGMDELIVTYAPRMVMVNNKLEQRHTFVLLAAIAGRATCAVVNAKELGVISVPSKFWFDINPAFTDDTVVPQGTVVNYKDTVGNYFMFETGNGRVYMSATEPPTVVDGVVQLAGTDGSVELHRLAAPLECHGVVQPAIFNTFHEMRNGRFARHEVHSRVYRQLASSLYNDKPVSPIKIISDANLPDANYPLKTFFRGKLDNPSSGLRLELGSCELNIEFKQ